MARAFRRNGRSRAWSSNGDGGALRARMAAEGEVREGEWTSANGSRGGGECDRGLLVADQGASAPAHARHATAEPCRLATAARRGQLSRVDAGAGAGRGKVRWWAGPASASGPEARPRPASAPPFPFPFF